jgi:S1-C subfamily serine protease
MLELYNLKKDPGENNNLINAQPDKAAELHNKLIRWREQISARVPYRKKGSNIGTVFDSKEHNIRTGLCGTSSNGHLAKLQYCPSYNGLYLYYVVEKSPADKAGLNPSDIIMKIGDIPIADADDMQKVFSTYKPSDTVEITYWRRKKQTTRLKITAMTD